METGIRVVVAETMDDVRERSRYRLRKLFGKYAFNGTLDDVLKDYKKL